MFFGCTVWLTGSWVLDQWLNPQSPNYWTTHPENFWIFGFRVFINFGKISDIIYSSIWFYFLSLSNCIYARLFDNVQKTIEVPFEYFSYNFFFLCFFLTIPLCNVLSICPLLVFYYTSLFLLVDFCAYVLNCCLSWSLLGHLIECGMEWIGGKEEKEWS